MPRFRPVLFAAAALFTATPGALSSAWAHHGWSGQEEQLTSLSGTVVEGVSMAGPHATMKIKSGNDVWDLTLAPPARTARSGLKEGLIPVGATVTVRGNRNSDHSRHEMKTIFIQHGSAEYHVYPDRE
ncbi:MAG: hypothetical protein BGN85_02350 [Alphaproteobacteria bacterium 64-11]|nr:hypothetical protein [Alphaproteobacteria bacterium]OJU13611.1 MAG: hypothetical protein BGN85_02350 [Alphaproteobacteria bacterium 64-11]